MHHGVRIQDAALVAAVRLSSRYLPERKLPDKPPKRHPPHALAEQFHYAYAFFGLAAFVLVLTLIMFFYNKIQETRAARLRAAAEGDV